MNKLFHVFLAIGLVLASFSFAGAEVINDSHNGNGVVVSATAEEIIVTINFSPADKSTNGGRVKYSVPYHGKPSDDGEILAQGGEVFIGHLGYAGAQTINSAPFTVPASGKGPLSVRFKNPSSEGNTLDVVVAISKDGKKLQWPCIPWEPNYVFFAKPNSAHPKGTQHTITFRVQGAKLSTLVAEAREFGWAPAREYWAVRGIKFGEGGGDPWSHGNLMSGEAPAGSAPPTRKAPSQ
ncbi:MAG: hypothetical protein WCT39_02285 [Candidatus Margulisiibacteriota bacterium]